MDLLTNHMHRITLSSINVPISELALVEVELTLIQADVPLVN